MLRFYISQPPSTVTDNVYVIVQRDVSKAIALPIPKVLLKHVKHPWAKPASNLVISRCLDHMYQVQQEGAEFLFAHSKPNSVVITTASKSRKRHLTLSVEKG